MWILDGCCRYHSESGWQTLVEVLVEHYGFEVDQSVITIFICLVPVIIDACVKLWVCSIIHSDSYVVFIYCCRKCMFNKQVFVFLGEQLFKFLPRLSPKVANLFREMKRHQDSCCCCCCLYSQNIIHAILSSITITNAIIITIQSSVIIYGLVLLTMPFYSLHLKIVIFCCKTVHYINYLFIYVFKLFFFFSSYGAHKFQGDIFYSVGFFFFIFQNFRAHLVY